METRVKQFGAFSSARRHHGALWRKIPTCARGNWDCTTNKARICKSFVRMNCFIVTAGWGNMFQTVYCKAQIQGCQEGDVFLMVAVYHDIGSCLRSIPHGQLTYCLYS